MDFNNITETASSRLVRVILIVLLFCGWNGNDQFLCKHSCTFAWTIIPKTTFKRKTLSLNNYDSIRQLQSMQARNQKQQQYQTSPSVFSTTRYHKQSIISTTKLCLVTTTSTTSLPDGYQEYGNQIIYDAALRCGCTSKEQVDIQWKGDKIIVSIQGNEVYCSNPNNAFLADDDDILLLDDDTDNDDDDEEEEEMEDDINLKYDVMDDDLDYDDDEINDVDDDNNNYSTDGTIDITAIARAINSALDDIDGIGSAIATNFEIEVTTPGASDEIVGSRMFEAYKGFDVIVQHVDSKKKKKKEDDDETVTITITTEGKLSDRTDEHTILNIKGRMKKIKNEDIISVKLPKAKKEKGVR